MIQLAFRWSVVSTAVLGSSVSQLTEQMHALRLDSPTAAQVMAEFSAIGHGSFTSVSEFRKRLPLEKLLKTRADLFRRLDGTDPMEHLARDLGVTRLEAVDNFLSHNYHQIDSALLKILGSTNDVVIAAVVIDPFGAADSQFLLPITELIEDYRVIKRTRCLLELLPDAFQDPAVYDTYFSPLDDYPVSPRDEIGYTAILHKDPSLRLIKQLGGSSSTQVRKGILSIDAHPHGMNHMNTLVDIRKGCAVSVKHPYRIVLALDLDNWLALDILGSSLVWRKDSLTPLLLPVQGFRISADLSHVLAGYEYRLPTELGVPFVATRIVAQSNHALLQPFKSFDCSYINGDDCEYGDNNFDGVIAVVSDARFARSRRFSEDLSHAVTTNVGCSMQELEQRLYPICYEVRSVYSLINLVNAMMYPEAFLKAMELCTRFNLKSRDELVQFIASVVNGARPLGVDLKLRLRFISNSERLKEVVSQRRLKLKVFINRTRLWMWLILIAPSEGFGRYLGRREFDFTILIIHVFNTVKFTRLVTTQLSRTSVSWVDVIAFGLIAFNNAVLLGPEVSLYIGNSGGVNQPWRYRLHGMLCSAVFAWLLKSGRLT